MPVDPENFDELVSELLNLGFDIASSKRALRHNEYNVDAAATKLFEEENELKSLDSDDDSVYDEMENDDDSKKQRFTHKKKNELGDFKEVYKDLSKQDKILITKLEKETNQERAVIVQVFLACDKNYDVTLVCLKDGTN